MIGAQIADTTSPVAKRESDDLERESRERRNDEDPPGTLRAVGIRRQSMAGVTITMRLR